MLLGVCSVICDLLLIIAGVLLAAASQKFSTTYMLGIDAILIGILMLVLAAIILFAGIAKPDGYYS